jgi:hypothetical protein
MDNNECEIKLGESGTPFIIQKGAWGGFWIQGGYIMVDENGGPSTADYPIEYKTREQVEKESWNHHFWPKS